MLNILLHSYNFTVSRQDVINIPVRHGKLSCLQ